MLFLGDCLGNALQSKLPFEFASGLPYYVVPQSFSESCLAAFPATEKTIIVDSHVIMPLLRDPSVDPEDASRTIPLPGDAMVMVGAASGNCCGSPPPSNPQCTRKKLISDPLWNVMGGERQP
eukprot:4494888-Amphidinium_carterae.1